MSKNIFKVCEVEVVYKNPVKIEDRISVQKSLDAYNVLNDNWSGQIGLLEEFNILLLDHNNKVLALSRLSKGGVSGTVVDLKVAFATALKAKASGLILSHNHPSGTLRPSQADISLTRKFQQAGELLDIKILDHIILSPDGKYYSFADEGCVL